MDVRAYIRLTWKSPLWAVNTTNKEAAVANKEAAVGLLQHRIGQGGNSKDTDKKIGGVEEKPSLLGWEDEQTGGDFGILILAPIVNSD